MPDATIPRRVLYRALADCVGGQARHLESLTPGRTAGRRDRIAAEDAAGKVAGRAARAGRLRATADTLARWIGDPARYQGPPLGAADAGLLIALAYGHAEAAAELRGRHPGRLDDLAAGDLLGFVARLCPIAD